MNPADMIQNNKEPSFIGGNIQIGTVYMTIFFKQEVLIICSYATEIKK